MSDDVSSPPIPISRVQLDQAVEASVLEVLRSGILAQGQKVDEFETAFGELIGARHVIAVNNGTTAITVTTTGLTVYKAGTPTAWATGNTLGVRGMATLLKVGTDTWFISGAGLS